MDSKLLTLRCNILHQMNEYILLWGDEDIIDEWIIFFPDEATEDDILSIAEDESMWIKCIGHFEYCCELMLDLD